MSEISKDLRDFVKTKERYLYSASRSELLGLANRIDAEMVEWPLGADKKPIKPSQTVYKAINGDDGEYVVHSLRCSVPGWVALVKRVGTDSSCIVRPDVLTHERPDSWERIADELDEMVDAARSADDTCEKLADLADRIRKLAKGEGKR